jgi:hypothetical protein
MSEKVAEEIVDNFTFKEVEEIVMRIINGETVNNIIQDIIKRR